MKIFCDKNRENWKTHRPRNTKHSFQPPDSNSNPHEKTDSMSKGNDPITTDSTNAHLFSFPLLGECRSNHSNDTQLYYWAYDIQKCNKLASNSPKEVREGKAVSEEEKGSRW